MQMKIGRWEGLYPRIQSAAKHIRCGFVCGYRKIVGPFRSERSAIIGAVHPGVHGPDSSEDRSTKKEQDPHSESSTHLLTDNGSNFVIFSECALILLAN